MRLGRCDVSLIEFHRGAREGGVDIPALAVQAVPWAVRRVNLIGFVVGFQMCFDVRRFHGIGRANRIGGGSGSFEGVGHSQRDILAVIPNDVFFERWTSLFTDALKIWLRRRAGDLADVLAMKNRPYTGHLLGLGGIELDELATCDGRSDRHGIKHSGKVEISGVLRLSGHLKWAVNARRVSTDR